jgi:SOS-response transcriptional repressor LexA
VGQNNQIAERLQRGETVTWRPHGNSMTPRIKSGQLVTIEPATLSAVEVGDVVFAKVKGAYFLHLVRQVGEDGRVLIANAHGHVNGWSRQVFGKLVKVEP